MLLVLPRTSFEATKNTEPKEYDIVLGFARSSLVVSWVLLAVFALMCIVILYVQHYLKKTESLLDI